MDWQTALRPIKITSDGWTIEWITDTEFRHTCERIVGAIIEKRVTTTMAGQTFHREYRIEHPTRVNNFVFYDLEDVQRILLCRGQQ